MAYLGSGKNALNCSRNLWSNSISFNQTSRVNGGASSKDKR